MLTRLHATLVVALLLLTGCGTTPATRSVATWNVAVETIPAGAEVRWSQPIFDANEGNLGLSPVASTALPLKASVSDAYRVQIFATLKNGKTADYSADCTNPQQLAALPKTVTIDFRPRYKFHAEAGIRHLREFDKNPERWSSYVFSIEGKVVAIEEKPNGTTVQLRVDLEQYGERIQKMLIVNWPKGSMDGVLEGSGLCVLGNVTGRTSGTNGFGATVSALTFSAVAYRAWGGRSDYIEAKRSLYDRWADGSLFLGEELVTLAGP
jgi:hypothetical protein